jgi:hypothetical protein
MHIDTRNIIPPYLLCIFPIQSKYRVVSNTVLRHSTLGVMLLIRTLVLVVRSRKMTLKINTIINSGNYVNNIDLYN